MIILIIAVFTVLTFYTWLLISKPYLRNILGTLSVVALACSVYMLTDHFVNRTGLDVKSETSSHAIYSAGDKKAPFGVLIAQEIGTKSDRFVLVYRDNPNDEQASAHFAPDKSHPADSIKKVAKVSVSNVDSARIDTTIKKYVWKSELYKILFGFGSEEGQIVSEENIAVIPEKTWLVLSPEQAKEMKEKITELQKNMSSSPEKIKEMAELKEKDPKKAVEVQVGMIKKMLNK